MAQASRAVVDDGTDEGRRHEGEGERQGVVVEMLPKALYVVELEPRQRIVAHLSGHPRRNFVRVMTGDRVAVALSPRDRTRGRITRRLG